MFGLGTTELIIIFLILTLLFGASKLPKLGGSIGSAIKNFKKTVSDDETEIVPKDENKT